MSVTTDTQDGAFSRSSYNGEEYLVAPVTAIREGVYLYPRTNGKGVKREFLPSEEIANTVDEWADKPLTLGHPTDDEDRPGLIEDPDTTYTNVGFFRNVVHNNKKLGGEVWIDTSEIGEHDGTLQGIVNKAKSGIPVEVSTGYRANTEYERGEYEGQRYTYVQREPEPDHLALLPHSTGNCSVDDECGVGKRPNVSTSGVRVNHRVILNIRRTARTPDYDGTETIDEQPWSDVSKTLTNFVDSVGIEYEGTTPTVDELTQSERSQIASLTLLGDTDSTNTRELMMFPVVNPATGNLNEGALEAVIGGRGQSADIPQEAYESAASKARQLLVDEFGRETRDNAELSAVTFEAEGEYDPELVKETAMMLRQLDGIEVHTTNSGYNPKLHVVAFPMKVDEIVDYREAFKRAFRDSPFEIEDEFEDELSRLPGGGIPGDVENVGRLPDTTIDLSNEGTNNNVSDTVVGEFRRLRNRLNQLLGDSAEEPTGDTESTENKNNDKPSNETTMERETLTNEISENSDLDPDSLEDLTNEALEAIHGEIVNSEPDDDGPEDTVNEDIEELRSELEEQRETVNELQEQLEAEKREKEEQLNERLVENTEMSEETVEGMSLTAKEELVNEFDETTEEDDDTEIRSNFSGIPGEADYDMSGDDLDVPVAGQRETGGDEE